MKRVLSVVLVLLMAFSGAVTAFAAEDADAAGSVTVPADVQGTVYEEAVKTLLSTDVISGYKDGTYRPANTLTRAEACAFLVNYLKPSEEELAAAKDSGFSDVSGWAVPYVNYAVEKGIVSGYKDKTFRPANTVTYQEMAAMSVNALGYKGSDLTGSWPANYVNKAKELGMYESISVSKKNTDAANRGDAALMVYSLTKYKTAEDAVKAVAARMENSSKAMEDVKSMSYNMVMDMALSQGGEKAEMKADMKMDMIMEPMAMYASANITAEGENQKVEYYYITENNVLTMYMNMDGQWVKMALGDMSQLTGSSNPAESVDTYLNAYGTVRVEGKDVVNGKTATKVYCEISDEYMEKMIEQSGALDNMAVLSPEEKTMVSQILTGMKGFGYELWLDDATGQLAKCRMDMTAMMQSVMEQTAAAMEKEHPEDAAELKGIRFDKVAVEMTLSNINSVKEITLPEAAKSATSVTELQ